jgi:dihydroxyacetone kinase-like predicted kinase
MDIKKNQAIGFLDGDLVAVGDKPDGVVQDVLKRVKLDEAEVITIYYGDDTTADEAEAVGDALDKQHPNIQVEVVQGGQPYYNYIVSVE